MLGDNSTEDAQAYRPGMSTIKLITGNAHPKLAEMVAQRLGIALVKCKVGKFANQETRYMRCRVLLHMLLLSTKKLGKEEDVHLSILRGFDGWASDQVWFESVGSTCSPF